VAAVLADGGVGGYASAGPALRLQAAVAASAVTAAVIERRIGQASEG